MANPETLTTPNSHLVFIYGTLKCGQPNHYMIQDETRGSAKLVGEGTTVKPYPLIIATDIHSPFLLDAEGLGMRIKGDIYKVDEKMLQFLDKIESHPSLYTRDTISVEVNTSNNASSNSVTDSMTTKECHTYFMRDFKLELLELQFHDVYDAYGEHGLTQVSPGCTDEAIENYRRSTLQQIKKQSQ